MNPNISVNFGVAFEHEAKPEPNHKCKPKREWWIWIYTLKREWLEQVQVQDALQILPNDNPNMNVNATVTGSGSGSGIKEMMYNMSINVYLNLNMNVNVHTN